MNYLGGYESDSDYDSYGGRLPSKTELRELDEKYGKNSKKYNEKIKLIYADNTGALNRYQQNDAKAARNRSMQHKKELKERIKSMNRSKLVKIIEEHLINIGAPILKKVLLLIEYELFRKHLRDIKKHGDDYVPTKKVTKKKVTKNVNEKHLFEKADKLDAEY